MKFIDPAAPKILIPWESTKPLFDRVVTAYSYFRKHKFSDQIYSPSNVRPGENLWDVKVAPADPIYVRGLSSQNYERSKQFFYIAPNHYRLQYDENFWYELELSPELPPAPMQLPDQPFVPWSESAAIFDRLVNAETYHQPACTLDKFWEPSAQEWLNRPWGYTVQNTSIDRLKSVFNRGQGKWNLYQLSPTKYRMTFGENHPWCYILTIA